MVFSSSIFLFFFLPLVLILYFYPLYLPASGKIRATCALTAGFLLFLYFLPMLFSIWLVAGFAALLFLANEFLPIEKILPSERNTRNFILLIFSIFFYAWGEPLYVFLLLLSCFVNYLFGLWVGKHTQSAYGKFIIALTVLYNISIFFIFKYMGFVFGNINHFCSTNLPMVEIALPIGISFYTFQALSYVIDVYRGTAPAEKNPFKIALYISLFPQLIAGPIVRYGDVAKELTDRKENMSDFASGTVRFTVGLAKKMILANSCAVLADAAFNAPESELTVLLAWMGAIGYTFQIYFDFSGYSDMAIGLGRMFGFHFMENFNFPYIARSITDFWRRWHISLSTWFRDYVYFPLGGSRVSSKWRLFFNLFVVWLLTGVWHGANWTFIVWGLFYFVLLMIEKTIGWDKKNYWWGWFYTMPAVIAAWVFFRTESIGSAWQFLKTMCGLGGKPLFDPGNVFLLQDYAPFLILATLFSIPILPKVLEQNFYIDRIGNEKVRFAAYRAMSVICFFALLCVFLLAVSFVVKSTNNPFIYFNF